MRAVPSRHATQHDHSAGAGRHDKFMISTHRVGHAGAMHVELPVGLAGTEAKKAHALTCKSATDALAEAEETTRCGAAAREPWCWLQVGLRVVDLAWRNASGANLTVAAVAIWQRIWQAAQRQ